MRRLVLLVREVWRRRKKVLDMLRHFLYKSSILRFCAAAIYMKLARLTAGGLFYCPCPVD